MGHHRFTIRNITLFVLVILTIGVVWVGFATYSPELTGRGHLFLFLAEHHLTIMAAMVIVAASTGFLAAWSLNREVEREQRGTTSILNVVLKFLSADERNIVHFLVQQGGSTTQAEISRLQGMTRVKAYRALQRMQQQGVIVIEPHGKMRKIHLHESIRDALAR